jgi:hypothetical protein
MGDIHLDSSIPLSEFKRQLDQVQRLNPEQVEAISESLERLLQECREKASGDLEEQG